jgi:hypothetical protein
MGPQGRNVPTVVRQPDRHGGGNPSISRARTRTPGALWQRRTKSRPGSSHIEEGPDLTTRSPKIKNTNGAVTGRPALNLDVQTFPKREVHKNAGLQVPIDAMMKQLTEIYRPPNNIFEYFAKVRDNRQAVPFSTHHKGPCGRMSVLEEKAGLDIVEMYPAKDAPPRGWMPGPGTPATSLRRPVPIRACSSLWVWAGRPSQLTPRTHGPPGNDRRGRF